MMVKKDRGVTLIELLIVMVIAAFLVAGIYSLFITQHRSYAVQDQVAGVQQDARVALDIMARDIRTAGFMIGRDGFDIHGAQFAVTRANNTNSPDSITVASAADQFMSGANPATVTNVNNNQVTLRVYNPVTDTWTDASIGGFFDTSTYNFVSFEGDGMNSLYQITGKTTDTLTLNPTPPANLATITGMTGSPPELTEVGARVFRVKAITYQVQNNVLQRSENGGSLQPLAGDGINTIVEDLQFAYQVAGSTDWIFDADTPTWPAGKDEADIRMVRISIIVRTAVPDPQDTTFFKPQCEDRPQENTFTGCRRRVYTTVVKVRNL